MLVHFKGHKYELSPGSHVKLDSRTSFSAGTEKRWVAAIVLDCLSVQFTAEIQDADRGRPVTVFRHYNDVGRSWKPLHSPYLMEDC